MIIRPITFGNCFGFIHHASSSHGVVMCSPLGFEELGTHRSWRELANEFAKQNIPTLRFDYQGTNNSLGDEAEPDRLHTWIDDVVQAVDYFRTLYDLKSITLVGLRIGASFAAIAATKLQNIDQLVLMAPVINGRNLVKELRLVSEGWMAAWPNVNEEKTNAHLDVIGYRFYQSTLNDINKIDLNKLSTPFGIKILVLDSGKRSDVAKFAERLNSQQVDVKLAAFNGYDEFMRDSVLSVYPTTAFDEVVQWVVSNASTGLRNSNILCPSSLPLARFKIENGVEQSMLFGVNHQLFGIVSKPDKNINNHQPAVVILNTGPNHTVGNGRLSVLLARRLVNIGVTALRFDVAGVGDSESVPERINLIYNTEAVEDVKDAVRLLNTEVNTPVVVLGLCSGAYLAFHSIIQFEQISAAVLVNLQRFVWTENTSLSVPPITMKRPVTFYIKTLVRKSAWKRLIKGESNARHIILSLRKKLKGGVDQLLDLVASKQDDSTNEVKEWFKDLSKKDKNVCLWYSEYDPGLAELSRNFGSTATLLSNYPNIKLNIIKEADHSMNIYSSRMKFIKMFQQYLQQEFN